MDYEKNRTVSVPADASPTRPSVCGPLRLLLLAALGCPAAEDAAAPAGDVPASPEVSQDAAGPGPDAVAVPSCQNPTPVLLEGGGASGFVRCADGALNRVASEPLDPTNAAEACRGTETQLSCSSDADCTAGSHGRCIHYESAGELPAGYCACEYACVADADCAEGSACVPREVTGNLTRPACVPAACAVGADCPSGECGLSDFHNGCSAQTALVCRDAAADECRGDSECLTLSPAATCDAESQTHFACTQPNCDIGRPLRVAGLWRAAPVVRRTDWSARA